MNRIITILVTIFILLLLYIWISHVWGSEKPRHPRQITDARETGVSTDPMDETDTVYSTTPYDTTMAPARMSDDEFATERKVAESTDAVAQEKTKSEPEPAVKEMPKKEEKKPETKKTGTATGPATSTTVNNKPATTPAKTETKTPAKKETPVISKPVSPTGGQHLVIAGNFTQLANAQQRVKELKKAGFADAEVVNFDLSEYHTVCAGRFADVNEARKLVKKLKDYHKIDAYVRIGS